MAESSGSSDAVGDVSLVNDKWGPSIGLFQIRSLRHPEDYGAVDRLRVASDVVQHVFHGLGVGVLARLRAIGAHSQLTRAGEKGELAQLVA